MRSKTYLVIDIFCDCLESNEPMLLMIIVFQNYKNETINSPSIQVVKLHLNLESPRVRVSDAEVRFSPVQQEILRTLNRTSHSVQPITERCIGRGRTRSRFCPDSPLLTHVIRKQQRQL